jgi:cellulase/cellobiase CelA1
LPSGNVVSVAGPGSQTDTVGTAIAALQIHATDSASGQSPAYTVSGLPPGLSISSLGLISGTPTAAGSFNVTVTATDSTGGGTCQVSYVKNEWSGGFTATVTVTNTGTGSVNGWSLAFSFPGDQKITNAWNATVTQAGSAVTAANVSYNAAIAPGGNVQFGFQGSWQRTTRRPAPSLSTEPRAARA